jgi:ribosome recycling factor
MATVEDFQQKSISTLDSFRKELQTIRTGRASITILDPVHVSCYGAMMPLSQVATVRIGDATSIIIEPWDKQNIPAIEKGIIAANLGVSAVVEGTLLRINLPPLTEDKRKDLAKQVNQKAEHAKAVLRNLGIKAKESIKEESESDDDEFRMEKELQTHVDETMKKIDEIKDKKIHEIMEI